MIFSDSGFNTNQAAQVNLVVNNVARTQNHDATWLYISRTMSKYIFDYDDGDFAMSISDSMAMDSDGDLMMRMGDHMAMDMDTGDIHMISSWSDDDEE